MKITKYIVSRRKMHLPTTSIPLRPATNSRKQRSLYLPFYKQARDCPVVTAVVTVLRRERVTAGKQFVKHTVTDEPFCTTTCR